MNRYSIHLACLGAVLGLLTVSAAAVGGMAARRDAARKAADRQSAEAAVFAEADPAADPESEDRQPVPASDSARTDGTVRVFDPEEDAAAFAPQEAQPADGSSYLVALRIHRRPIPARLVLSDAAGNEAEIVPDAAGDAVLGPIPPGTYTVLADGAILGRFLLLPDAVLADTEGELWTDGELLHLSDYAAGRAELLLSFPRPGRYSLRLSSSFGGLRIIQAEIPETAARDSAGVWRRAVSLCGLRPGSYVLSIGDEPLCSFVLEAGETVFRDAALP